MTFLQALAEQRWDDHRYYHHSRVNQTLHLVSAFSFLGAYLLVFVEPAAAVLIAWLVAMPLRQAGHFFFEPRDYDVPNQATHEYKEQVKVGYNLQRKVVLMSAWAVSPLLLVADPTLLGLVTPYGDLREFANQVAVMWLVIGVVAVVVRTVQLFYLRDIKTGLVWCTKILTDPFHDVLLYHKAPLHLLRGEWFDPIVDGRHGAA